MISLLALSAAVAAAPPYQPGSVELPKSERFAQASKTLDGCLSEAAIQIGRSDQKWPARYAAYFQSCATEKAVVLETALAHLPATAAQQERHDMLEKVQYLIGNRIFIYSWRELDRNPVMWTPNAPN